MELLVHHDLEEAIHRRIVELRQPRTERHEHQQAQARQLAEIGELVEFLGAGFRAEEVVNCIERLRTAPTVVVWGDHDGARNAAHDAIAAHEVTAPAVFAAPGMASRTHSCADEAFDLLNNLRKPLVVAVAAVTLALRGQTVASVRAGALGTSLYAGLG